MNRALHDANQAKRILQMTADTLLLVDPQGYCIDIDSHSNLWFLQENILLGKNLFELLPLYTKEKIRPIFQEVLQKQTKISKNYKLELNEGTYYFKCIMQPYDSFVLCQYRDITQRSNIKKQLEQTNKNLQEIQKAAQISQWRFNSNDHIIRFSGFTNMLSTMQEQEIKLEDYIELIVNEDKAQFIEWYKCNLHERKNQIISFRVYFNNEISYLRAQSYLHEVLPDGSLHMEGYVQNITDIQRRRNDINTLTHAINNAKESIFAAKKDGTLIFANREFMKNHSLPETTDINTLKIYNISGDMHTVEQWEERCREALKKGSAGFISYHPLKRNSRALAFEGVMYKVTSDSGEESIWSFSHNISERLRYESQIKRLNQIMDTTINNLPAGIVVKDANNDFCYLYRNRESYNRISFSNNPIGKNDFDYYPVEIAKQKRSEDIEVATTGKGMHWTVEGKDKNGNLIILDKRKIRVSGDDFVSPIIVSIEWDVTELELMRRELQAAKEKAELSDDLKSAFLANMSHEIRTPLNAIVGFSRLIAESDDQEERKAFYDIVEKNNERLLQLINEILDLSKIESGTVVFTISAVPLSILFKEVYDAHIFRTPKGVELIYERPDQDLVIDTDKNRIFQVMSNLIGNAFKFTKEGTISYGYKQDGNKIAFHVTDTGVGIEKEKLGEVFKRFAKLNNFAQGTGLGLSICKSIIERLGGEITVDSIYGKGTTFTFTLPYLPAEGSGNAHLQQSENVHLQQSGNIIESSFVNKHFNKLSAEMTSEVEARKEQKHDSKITILIAEDNDSNFDLLKAILGKNYKLVHARNGIEAVTLFEQFSPDLILMDIKMPDLDGLETTKIIRELSPDVPIIAQSAYAFEQDRKDAAEAGCNDFITKPISQTILNEVINKWLHKR